MLFFIGCKLALYVKYQDLRTTPSCGTQKQERRRQEGHGGLGTLKTNFEPPNNYFFLNCLWTIFEHVGLKLYMIWFNWLWLIWCLSPSEHLLGILLSQRLAALVLWIGCLSQQLNAISVFGYKPHYQTTALCSPDHNLRHWIGKSLFDCLVFCIKIEVCQQVGVICY